MCDGGAVCPGHANGQALADVPIIRRGQVPRAFRVCKIRAMTAWVEGWIKFPRLARIATRIPEEVPATLCRHAPAWVARALNVEAIRFLLS